MGLRGRLENRGHSVHSIPGLDACRFLGRDRGHEVKSTFEGRDVFCCLDFFFFLHILHFLFSSPSVGQENGDGQPAGDAFQQVYSSYCMHGSYQRIKSTAFDIALL